MSQPLEQTLIAETPAAVVLSPLPLRVLIVHDDLAIRLRLADRLMPHAPGAVLDSCGTAAALALGPQLREYTAAIVIVNLARTGRGNDPLAIVPRLLRASPSLVVTVIGSGGDERSAVDALRAGAVDYWPLHNVDSAALIALLRARFLASTVAVAIEGATVGPTIAGYRLIRELSSSPTSTLYLAHSEARNIAVAIKLHGDGTRDSDSEAERDRFLRECQLLGRLEHNAIAEVYDFGVTDGCHWLAMEYFPCGSLAGRMRNPIPEEEAVGYATRIAVALGAVHAAGIVHRDLKPSNIMRRADNSIALIDFGLARPLLSGSDLTAPNIRVGSPSYMAPEQVQGRPPDERCDLYALGVVFYELLTGELPYEGTDIQRVLEAQLHAPIPALPTALVRYQALVDRLLAKHPDDRFQSADEFVRAISRVTASV